MIPANGDDQFEIASELQDPTPSRPHDDEISVLVSARWSDVMGMSYHKPMAPFQAVEDEGRQAEFLVLSKQRPSHLFLIFHTGLLPKAETLNPRARRPFRLSSLQN